MPAQSGEEALDLALHVGAHPERKLLARDHQVLQRQGAEMIEKKIAQQHPKRMP